MTTDVKRAGCAAALVVLLATVLVIGFVIGVLT